MTVPFEPEDVIKLAAWVIQPTPGVRAKRLPCHTEDEWLLARARSVGASEIGIVLGKSSFCSPYALWYRKKLDWRLPRTEQMKWGHLTEEPIANLFAEEKADDLYVAKPLGAPWSLWVDPQYDWMTCTPDRLAVDQEGQVSPVEVKSDEGGKDWGKPGTDEVPEHHRMQSLWQSHIFGAEGGYVVRKPGSGRKLMVWYYVPYDAAVVAPWIAAGYDFLLSIQRNEPPDPDGTKSTTETLKEINPAIDGGAYAEVHTTLAVQWAAARRAKNEAIAREAEASNALRAAMSRAEYAMTSDGTVFAKRSIGKRSGYTVAPGTTDELRQVNSEQPATPRDLPGPAEPGGEVAPEDLAPGEGSHPPVRLPDADPEAASPPEEEEQALGIHPAERCSCGHEGLDRWFHLYPCPIKGRPDLGGDFAEQGYDPDNLRPRRSDNA